MSISLPAVAIGSTNWGDIVNSYWAIIQDAINASAIPSGILNGYAGTSVPDGWLECDGSAVSRTTYAALFSAIGTTWGSGDGSTTFNLPDLRGRCGIGAGTGAGLSPRALGAIGGEETHTLTSSEMPSHTHTQNAHTHVQDAHTHTQNAHTHTQNAHTHTQDAHNHGTGDATYPNFLLYTGPSGSTGISSAGAFNQNIRSTTGSTTATNQSTTATNQNATATNNNTTATNQNATATNQSTGGDGTHNNMQPFSVVKWIIKI